VFAKKGRSEKADVTTLNAEYTPTDDTLVIIVKRNAKNTVKNEPWSALYGSATLGSQLPSSAHKDLPTPATHYPLDQVKTSGWSLTRPRWRRGSTRSTGGLACYKKSPRTSRNLPLKCQHWNATMMGAQRGRGEPN
jgi:hypothetical protein